MNYSRVVLSRSIAPGATGLYDFGNGDDESTGRQEVKGVRLGNNHTQRIAAAATIRPTRCFGLNVTINYGFDGPTLVSSRDNNHLRFRYC